MVILRPYQAQLGREIIDAWRVDPRVMAQMATGGGKTKLACDLISKAVHQWGNTAAVIVHTRELRKQWVDDLRAVGIEPGVIAANVAPNPYARCQVIQVQTLIARKETKYWSLDCDLLVIDEAHHSAANTYVQAIELLNPEAMLGLSATPARLDGRGFRGIYGKMVYGPPVAELIELGALSRYRIRSVDIVDIKGIRKRGGEYARKQTEERVRGKIANALTAWRHEAGTHQTIAFCITRQHGIEARSKFEAGGFAAGYVDGEMHPNERDAAIDDFRSQRTQILFSVDVLGEGIDIPGATCALLMRPTASVVRHLQGIGRALRPHEHPSGESVVVDTVGNCQRLGGPLSAYLWSLDGVKKRPERRQDRSENGAGNPRDLPEEVECKFITVNDAAIQINRTAYGWDKRNVAHAVRLCETLSDYKALGRDLGYAKSWAFMKYRIAKGKRDER